MEYKILDKTDIALMKDFVDDENTYVEQTIIYILRQYKYFNKKGEAIIMELTLEEKVEKNKFILNDKLIFTI